MADMPFQQGSRDRQNAKWTRRHEYLPLAPSNVSFDSMMMHCVHEPMVGSLLEFIAAGLLGSLVSRHECRRPSHRMCLHVLCAEVAM